MAHRIKVAVRPHKNKDGSDSKTKKDYTITDKSRGKRRVIATTMSKSEAYELRNITREAVLIAHARKHPNDLAFRRKHPELFA